MQTEQNVFVGISLQNKKLDIDIINQFLSVAQNSFQARNLCFLIADEIDLINHRAFGKGNEKSLRRKVESRAKELEELIKNALAPNKSKDLNIHFCRWADVLTKEVWKLTMKIEHLFLNNEKFRNEISRIAKGYSENRAKKLEIYEHSYLCRYLIAEIPIIIRGIDYGGLKYRSMIYPVPKKFALDFVVDKLMEGDFGEISLQVDRCRIKKV